MSSRAGTLLVAAAAGCAAIPSTAQADWPVYGHDLANTRTASTDGPKRANLASIAQAWSFKSDTGDFTGTPVISQGVLVAGDQGGWVYALDAVSGKLLWKKQLGSRINGSAEIDESAPGG